MFEQIGGFLGQILYPLFSTIFVAINGIQRVFYAFAGVGDVAGMNITSANTGNEKDTGIIFYLLNQPLVKNMMFSIALLGLFLVIIFTVMAFIKNAYAAKQKGWKDIVGNAIKGLANFILIPVVCLLGVWLGNILLQAINGATSVGGTADISRSLFVTCAYDGNKFRTGDATQEDVEALRTFAKSHGYEATIQDGLSNEAYAKIVDEIYANYDVDIHWWGSVDDWYSLMSINYLILLVGGIFILYAFGSLAFGMVRRLFTLVILFVISPGVCAMYPLDEGKAVGQWKDKFIKEFLSVYGAIAGINIFFSILPLIKNIKLFADGTGLLNSLVSLFIMVSGLMVVKEITGLISGFFGADDAYGKSSGLIKQTTGKIAKSVVGGSVVMATAAARKKQGGSFFGSLAKQTGSAAAKASGFDFSGVGKAYKNEKENVDKENEAKSKKAKAKQTSKQVTQDLRDAGLVKHSDYEKMNQGDGAKAALGRAGKNVGRLFVNAGMSVGRFLRDETGLHRARKIDQDTINSLLDKAVDKDGNPDEKRQKEILEQLVPLINAGGKGRFGSGLKGVLGFSDAEAVTSEKLYEKYKKAKTAEDQREKFIKAGAGVQEMQDRVDAADSSVTAFKGEHADMFNENGELKVKKVSSSELETQRQRVTDLETQLSRTRSKDKRAQLESELSEARTTYNSSLQTNDKIDEFNGLKEAAEAVKQRFEEVAETFASRLESASEKMEGKMKLDVSGMTEELKNALGGASYDKIAAILTKIKETLENNDKKTGGASNNTSGGTQGK